MRTPIAIALILECATYAHAQTRSNAGNQGRAEPPVAPGDVVPALPLDELSVAKAAGTGQDLGYFLQGTEWKERSGPAVPQRVSPLGRYDLRICGWHEALELDVYGVVVEDQRGGGKQRELLVLGKHGNAARRGVRLRLRDVAPWAADVDFKSLVLETLEGAPGSSSDHPTFLAVRPVDEAKLRDWGLTLLAFEPGPTAIVARVALAYRGAKARLVVARPREGTGAASPRCQVADLFAVTEEVEEAYVNVAPARLPRFAWKGKAWLPAGTTSLPALRINVKGTETVAGMPQTARELLRLAYPDASLAEDTLGLPAPAEIDEVQFVQGGWLDVSGSQPKAVRGLLAQVNQRLGLSRDQETRQELLVFVPGPQGKPTVRARLVLEYDWHYSSDPDEDAVAAAEHPPRPVKLAPEANGVRLDRRSTVNGQDSQEWTAQVRFYALDGDKLRLMWDGLREKGSEWEPDGPRDTAKWSIRVGQRLSNGLYDLDVVRKGSKAFGQESGTFKFDGCRYVRAPSHGGAPPRCPVAPPFQAP